MKSLSSAIASANFHDPFKKCKTTAHLARYRDSFHGRIHSDGWSISRLVQRSPCFCPHPSSLADRTSLHRMSARDWPWTVGRASTASRNFGQHPAIRSFGLLDHSVGCLAHRQEINNRTNARTATSAGVQENYVKDGAGPSFFVWVAIRSKAWRRRARRLVCRCCGVAVFHYGVADA
jgi:hypothetical protein